jgi:hypothetical protein
MSSLANLHLQSNTKIKINFNGDAAVSATTSYFE